MKTKFNKKDLLLIPNILSYIRLLLIPVIVFLYFKSDNNLLVVGVILLSGFTDILDGYIARNYNMISDFGKVLDPFADKLTQAVILGCLVIDFPIIILPLVTLIIKEIILFITGLISIKNTNKVSGADWHGKLNTVLLYTTMMIHIIWRDIPNNISVGLFIMCEVMMIISLVLYTIRNLKK